MDSFPAFFPLKGAKVAIAGTGEAAEAKARLFKGSPAEILRLDEIEGLKAEAYAGARLAFIAGDEAYCRAAAKAAREAGALVNVVDRPALSDFNTPAVIDRGQVVAAIGTGGSAPLLASLLRNDMEARVPEGTGRVAALLSTLQAEVRSALPDLARRRAFLREQLSGPAAEAALAGDQRLAEQRLREALAAWTAGRGRVRVLRADGPTDLLTLRAMRALGEADVVVFDPDVNPQILDLSRRDAERIEASAATPARLAQLATERQVVRLIGAAADLSLPGLVAAGVSVEFLNDGPP